MLTVGYTEYRGLRRIRVLSPRTQTTVTPSFGSRRLGTFENLRTVSIFLKKKKTKKIKKEGHDCYDCAWHTLVGTVPCHREPGHGWFYCK